VVVERSRTRWCALPVELGDSW